MKSNSNRNPNLDPARRTSMLPKQGSHDHSEENLVPPYTREFGSQLIVPQEDLAPTLAGSDRDSIMPEQYRVPYNLQLLSKKYADRSKSPRVSRRESFERKDKTSEDSSNSSHNNGSKRGKACSRFRNLSLQDSSQEVEISNYLKEVSVEKICERCHYCKTPERKTRPRTSLGTDGQNVKNSKNYSPPQRSRRVSGSDDERRKTRRTETSDRGTEGHSSRREGASPESTLFYPPPKTFGCSIPLLVLCIPLCIVSLFWNTLMSVPFVMQQTFMAFLQKFLQ